MCRWFAYRGGAIRTSRLLLNPVHSIVAQSLDSPRGAERVNGDGVGFGWYPEDGGVPGVYRSVEPAWHDGNLLSIADAVHSPLFFCHVRAAAGPPIQQTNCHPFEHDGWLFMHNGFVADFARVKRDLVLAVDAGLYPSILGTTDSEVLFHLALTLGLRDDPVAGIARAVAEVERVGRAHDVEHPFQGTVAVTDGATVWAVRYSSEGSSRTLYHSADVDDLVRLYPGDERLEGFTDDAHVVVSEPLSDLPGVFVEVPESTSVVLDATGYRHAPFHPATDG